ncbi:hypothetical protein FGB62_9g05 [Gracilaria domingensis]|nr:hypothetical protein FGB62_9g05 [Gracilaria domingensis]
MVAIHHAFAPELNEAGARLDGVGAVVIGLHLVQRRVQSRAEHEAAGGLAAEDGVGGLQVCLREPVRHGGMQRRRRPGLGHVCRRQRFENGGHGGREGTRGGGGAGDGGGAGTVEPPGGACGAERGRYKTYRGMRRAGGDGVATAGGRDSSIARDCLLSGESQDRSARRVAQRAHINLLSTIVSHSVHTTQLGAIPIARWGVAAYSPHSPPRAAAKRRHEAHGHDRFAPGRHVRRSQPAGGRASGAAAQSRSQPAAGPAAGAAARRRRQVQACARARAHACARARAGGRLVDHFEKSVAAEGPRAAHRTRTGLAAAASIEAPDRASSCHSHPAFAEFRSRCSSCPWCCAKLVQEEAS